MNNNLTPDELIDKAECFQKDGKKEAALQLLQTLFQYDLEAEILYRLGNLAVELGQLEQAEQIFKKAIIQGSQSSKAYVELGILYLDSSRYSLAIKLLQAALEIEETDYTYNFLGVAQDSLGMREEARDSYTKALQLTPADEEVLYNLAFTWRSENPEKAVQLLNQSIQANPGYASAHRELGWMYLKTKEHAKAKNHLLKAVALNNKNGWSHIYLGLLLCEEGELQGAEEAFRTALKLWPDESVSHWTLGDLYWDQERTEEARQLYERAVELEPDDSQATHRLGLLLKALGEIVQAKFYLEQTIVLDPDNEKAKAALAELP